MHISRPNIPEAVIAIGEALHDYAPYRDLDCYYRLDESRHQIVLIKSSKKLIIYEHIITINPAKNTIAHRIFLNPVWYREKQIIIPTLPDDLQPISYPFSDPQWPEVFKRLITNMSRYYIECMVPK